MRYGVKSNCIAPAARTRLTLATPGLGDMIAGARPKAARSTCGTRPTSRPLVAYLAAADCAFNGETFFVQGGTVRIVKSWDFGDGVEQNERWPSSGLAEALAPLAPPAE